MSVPGVCYTPLIFYFTSQPFSAIFFILFPFPFSLTIPKEGLLLNIFFFGGAEKKKIYIKNKNK